MPRAKRTVPGKTQPGERREREPKDIPVVFISSTNEDLKLYRAAARDAAISSRLLPDMQEYFTASGERPPLEACLHKVSAADVIVVMVAHRYGWEPKQRAKKNKKSITWMECEQARKEGKEIIAFLVDDDCEWVAQREEDALTKAGRCRRQAQT